MLTTEDIRTYCLSFPTVTESFPFGPDVRVFKILDSKMFALMGLDNDPPELNLKCDPFHAKLLRDTYEAIKPGYHMNKKHWNTVIVDGSIPEEQIKELIDESFHLVLQGMRKAEREKVENLG